MPIMEPVSRLELPPLLLPPPLPAEDEELEVGVEKGAAPKRVAVFGAATPVGKSINVENRMLVADNPSRSWSLRSCSE